MIEKKHSHLYAEEKYKDWITFRYGIKKTLFSQKSKFQHVQVVETNGFGRIAFK